MTGVFGGGGVGSGSLFRSSLALPHLKAVIIRPLDMRGGTGGARGSAGGNVRVSGCSTDGMSVTGSSWDSVASGSEVGAAAFFLPFAAAF